MATRVAPVFWSQLVRSALRSVTHATGPGVDRSPRFTRTSYQPYQARYAPATTSSPPEIRWM